ncbi:hypothetical protein LTR37_006639 [Vermiconidia calcicola]|uniref:Uncharacterized protein n=1 Tax=Vermiconidia calcicola TaxID=1690605 RepID=A0ACC3NG36_9PEZI|nr:hypothetical protein LTR37_006639 [Vermiconidia calcicola]
MRSLTGKVTRRFKADSELTHALTETDAGARRSGHVGRVLRSGAGGATAEEVVNVPLAVTSSGKK